MKRYLHIDVDDSIICNRQEVEATQMYTKDGWISKMWYIHTVVYYAALTRKEFLSHATNMDDLKTLC